jgi:predicted nucleotidyltransferase
MIYHEQLKVLVDIYLRSEKAENDEFFDRLLKELRQLSNNWHDLKKNNELSFPEYTQLIEKKYHLSESLQLRRSN